MKIIDQYKIFLMLLFIICLIVPSVTALNVEFQSVLPNQNLNEGQSVEYSILITGIPQQTSFIDLITDLEPYNNTLLWNVTDLAKFGLNDSSPLLMQKTLRLSPPMDFNSPIMIKVSGKVPLIKQIIAIKGVVLCNIERDTGYRYYSVQPYDSNGYVVGNGDTKTFNIKPGNECIKPDPSLVDDPGLKKITQDLSDKGLWQESNTLINYSQNQPAKVTFLVYIASIVFIGIILFVIGVRIGRARAKKPDDGTGEIEMEEK